MANNYRRWSFPASLAPGGHGEPDLRIAAEEEDYLPDGENPFANAPDSGGHMSAEGMASLSLSEPPSHNTGPVPSGESESQDLLLANPQASSSSAAAQVESVDQPKSKNPAFYDGPLIVSSDNWSGNKMNPFFRGFSGPGPYSDEMASQAYNEDEDTHPGKNPLGNIPANVLTSQGTVNRPGLHENQPGLNPEAPVYQGAAGPFVGNMGQANHPAIPHAAGVPLASATGAAYQFAYNPQVGYNLIRPSHLAQGPNPNVLPNTSSIPSATAGNPPQGHQSAKPSIVDVTALEYMACVEAVVENGGRNSMPPKWGVLKITNIPYGLTKEEVVCLMGRNAKLVPHEMGCAIHIIMERSTAKTTDCYVEFITPDDARAALQYINGGLPAHPPRLGSRYVEVEMSSQDELLKALFPRAKCVSWRNGVPYILQNTDPYSTGYQGFFTQEEFYNIVRHAEFPRRAPFAEKCPQRTYENMISTMHKFPWYATTLYTVEDRNTLFSACRRQIVALEASVKKKNTMGLDERLLNDLLLAGLRCPVFNERQKVSLFLAAQAEGVRAIPLSSKCWPFDALTCRDNASEDAIAELDSFMTEASKVHAAGSHLLANKWTDQDHSAGGTMFGKVWFEWGWGNTHHKLQAAIEHEMQIIRDMAKALAKANLEKRNA